MAERAVKSESKETVGARAKAHRPNFEKDIKPENVNGFILQRQTACACGGDCPTCQAKHSNLPISHPTDAAEIEADHIADKIMRMSDDRSSLTKQNEAQPISANITPVVQAKSEGGIVASSELTGKIASSKGGGSDLDGGTRSFMQRRFGADFSGVKIHTDGEAVQMNREIGAKAFTVGNNIYFNAGEYQPHSESGKHLLAHELAHTFQQNEQINRQTDAGVPEPRDADVPVAGVPLREDQIAEAPPSPEPEDAGDQNAEVTTAAAPECGPGNHRIWGGFRIEGDCAFVIAVRDDLNRINLTSIGKSLLSWVTSNRSGFFTSYIPIRKLAPGFLPVRIYYDPSYTISDTCDMGPWRSAPAYVYLFHEIVHFWLYEFKSYGYHAERECMATGLGSYFTSMDYSENKLRCELGLPLRPCYGTDCTAFAAPASCP